MKSGTDLVAMPSPMAESLPIHPITGPCSSDLRSGCGAGRIRFADFVAAGLIAIATSAIYGQIGSHRPISFDDALYLTDNAWVLTGLTWEGVVWAFTNFDAANWHPITWLSHMVDQAIFGDLTGGHMIENPLWHIANGLLFFSVLRRLAVSREVAIAVVLMWVCHPLNVESVAWLSQRKSQLATFFLLSAVVLYLDWRVTRSARTLALMSASFLLSLMSKAAGVGLPLALLALEVALSPGLSGVLLNLRTRRTELIEWLKVLTPRIIPAGSVSLAFCLVTLFAQERAGAVASIGALSVSDRLVNSLAALGTYLKQFVSPSDLCFFYPFPEEPNFRGAAVGIVAVVVSFVCVIAALRRSPLIAFGVAWFYLFLLPVLGLVQVGSQTHADRYMYLPMIGLLVGLAVLLDSLRNSARIRMRSLAVFAVCGYSIVLGIGSYAYVMVWRGPESAYRHAIATRGHSYIMSSNLAATLMNWNYIASAEPIARLVAERWPERPLGSANLATILARQQRFVEAEAPARQAVALVPSSSRYHYLLGLIFVNLGREADAEQSFQTALGLLPPGSDWRTGDRFMRDVLLRKIPVRGADFSRLEPDQPSRDREASAGNP